MLSRGGGLGGVFLLVLFGCCCSTDPERRGECGRARSAEKRRESRWDSRKFGLTEASNSLFVNSSLFITT